AMVDVVGDFRIEIAERIVGKRGEMNYRIEPFEVSGLDIADVLIDGLHVRERSARLIGAAAIKVAVISSYVKAMLQEHGHHHRADVSAMPRHQNLHDPRSLLIFSKLSSVLRAGDGDLWGTRIRCAAAGLPLSAENVATNIRWESYPSSASMTSSQSSPPPPFCGEGGCRMTIGRPFSRFLFWVHWPRAGSNQRMLSRCPPASGG